jgi:hypothetical protein
MVADGSPTGTQDRASCCRMQHALVLGLLHGNPCAPPGLSLHTQTHAFPQHSRHIDGLPKLWCMILSAGWGFLNTRGGWGHSGSTVPAFGSMDSMGKVPGLSTPGSLSLQWLRASNLVTHVVGVQRSAATKERCKISARRCGFCSIQQGYPQLSKGFARCQMLVLVLELRSSGSRPGCRRPPADVSRLLAQPPAVPGGAGSSGRAWPGV